MPFSNALGSHEDKPDFAVACQDPPNDSVRFCCQKPKLNIKSAICRKVGMTNISDKSLSLCANTGSSPKMIGKTHVTDKFSNLRINSVSTWISETRFPSPEQFKSLFMPVPRQKSIQHRNASTRASLAKAFSVFKGC